MTPEQPELDFSKAASNLHSVRAHELLKPKKKSDRYEVWKLIHASGKQGLTCEQIAERMGKLPHQVSGRLSELRKQGAIFIKSEDGVTKENNSCAIYVA